jgi:hypothetical protein
MPLLTEDQLAELERRLLAAEKEGVEQLNFKMVKPGPAMKDLEFQAVYLIRRLLDDVKSYRTTHED